MGGLFSRWSTSNEASTGDNLTRRSASFQRSYHVRQRPANESDGSTPQAQKYASDKVRPAPRSRPGLPEEFREPSVSTTTPTEVTPKTTSTLHASNVVTPPEITAKTTSSLHASSVVTHPEITPTATSTLHASNVVTHPEITPTATSTLHASNVVTPPEISPKTTSTLHASSVVTPPEITPTATSTLHASNVVTHPEITPTATSTLHASNVVTPPEITPTATSTLHASNIVTPSEVTPKITSTLYASDVIAPKTVETVSRTPIVAQPEEAKGVLKSPFTPKDKEVEEEVNKKIEEVGEELQERFDEGLHDADKFRVVYAAKAGEVKFEAGVKPQQKTDENPHHVEDILSRLAPGDLSAEQSPEIEIAPKPAASSLLASLEKRKEKKEEEEKEEHQKKETSLSSGTSNVLETIAADSISIKSKEAANLMASMTLSPEEKPQQKTDEDPHHVEDILSRLAPGDLSAEQSPEIEIAPKPAASSLLASLEKRKEKKEEEEKEEHQKKETSLSSGTSNVLETIAADSISIKSKEAANLMASMTLSPEEKPQQKTDEDPHHVEDILSRLAPGDLSAEQSPEVEIAPKPAASSLLASPEKRKEKKEEEEKEEHQKKETSLSSGTSNVLETIAADSISIKSKEAANLMASMTLSPEEKPQQKTDEDPHHVEDILSRLAPGDLSAEQSPEIEIAPKPAASSLLASLEKRKEKKEEEEKEEHQKKETSLSSGTSNVLETIAADSISIKSKEAANLMASVTAHHAENVETGKKFDEKLEKESESNEEKKVELEKNEVEKFWN
ncbi:hypothetical protein Aperf_G00000116537 [Anoplocephala perfoliata]